MEFQLDTAIAVLERTPKTLESLLQGLPTDWTDQNEGAETWSAFDIVGHLIHGERTDWIPRMEIILSRQADAIFEPFDRFAMLQESKGKSLQQLLKTFSQLRAQNLEILRQSQLGEEHFKLPAIHPALGRVTLEQLLATWVVHDLDHLAQIARVMAKQYKEQVGPWRQFLPVLDRT